jgi:DNA (cytosine-5)-methyltransferase 1
LPAEFKVLDLFCGAGGFAAGFSKAGFDVTGVDNSAFVERTFKENFKTSTFVKSDLSKENIDGEYDVVVGGPPCKPWSAVNLQRRGCAHKDYTLLSKFFQHVENTRPRIFLLEYVPPVTSAPAFKRHLKILTSMKYSIESGRVTYADYGAATRGQRLFVTGFHGIPAKFFTELGQRSKYC